MTSTAVKKYQCANCKRLLPHTNEYFYTDTSAPRGFDYRCKVCRRDKARGNPTFHAKMKRKRLAHPEKTAARTAVRNAVARGKLAKSPNCEDCGAVTKLHGHHPDYSKPLSVDWLCVKCHAARHNYYGLKRGVA